MHENAICTLAHRWVASVGGILDANSQGNGTDAMTLTTILLVILVLILVGAIPAWPHSKSWGYGPSGLVGIIALIVVVLLLTGRI